VTGRGISPLERRGLGDLDVGRRLAAEKISLTLEVGVGRFMDIAKVVSALRLRWGVISVG